MNEPVTAAYIHWPFCHSKCQYCDFVSWAGCTELQPAYLASLQREIAAVSQWIRRQGLARPLTSLFIGGGTPTLLPPAGLASLLDTVRANLGIEPAAEVTLEANPGTVNPAGLLTLRQAGFNRISFGLQAAQAHLLHRLGRIHTASQFVDSVRWARTAGFRRISVDIMLGLPGQTLADVEETLDLLASLAIDHVSYYSLIIEPETPFYDLYANHPEQLPNDDLERTMYHRVRDILTARGLPPYEISNSARPGEACRHNLVYWQAQPYYGFGAGAHSYLAGWRRGNTTCLADYLAAWPAAADTGTVRSAVPVAAVQTAPSTSLAAADAAGDSADLPGPPFPAAVSQDWISDAEASREMLLLGLRLSSGVRWQDFQARFGCDARTVFAAEWIDLQRRDLVILDEAGVRLSPRGLDLGNQVFMAFV